MGRSTPIHSSNSLQSCSPASSNFSGSPPFFYKCSQPIFVPFFLIFRTRTFSWILFWHELTRIRSRSWDHENLFISWNNPNSHRIMYFYGMKHLEISRNPLNNPFILSSASCLDIYTLFAHFFPKALWYLVSGLVKRLKGFGILSLSPYKYGYRGKCYV